MAANATPLKNRVKPYLDEPRTLPPLPATAAERHEVMADAVFAAVLALQGLLTEGDPKVVIQAAGMILDLDKTQMRHATHVSGTRETSTLESDRDPIRTPPVGASPSAADKPAPTKRTNAERKRAYVEQVRAEMQRQADADGTGEVVSWEKAEWVAERILEHHQGAKGVPQVATVGGSTGATVSRPPRGVGPPRSLS